MPARAKPVSLGSNPLAALSTAIPALFDQSQGSAASHRKNVALLYRIFTEVSTITQQQDDGSEVLIGEKTFLTIVRNMVDHILDIKKGVTQADNILKFITAFVAFTLEKSKAAQQAGDNEDEDEEDDDQTPSSRFITGLLKYLLKAFSSKHKNVRLRSCQLVALLVNILPDIDETLYDLLFTKLSERVRDKEPSVRVHAAVGLAKLQDPENDDIDISSDTEDSPTSLLCKIVQQDSSAEVRRAALYQVAPSPRTLPFILARTKDVDSAARRLVFHSVLPEFPSFDALTFAERESIISRGLKDREPAVQRATSRLVCKWSSETDGGLIAFLDKYDIKKSTIGAEILKAIFETQPTLVELVEFDDSFFANLTPSSSFLLRNYVAYCRSIEDDRKLEDVLPVVTELAFKLEAEHNSLIVYVDRCAAHSDNTSAERKESDRKSLEDRIFVIQQLLVLALDSDYSDESGRRKMFSLIRDIIAHPDLPYELISDCLEILLKLSSDEGDFMRVVVEVVQWVREDTDAAGGAGNEDADKDDDEDEEDFDLDAPARPPVKFAEAVLDLDKAHVHIRCLIIVQGLLERVQGALQDNAALTGLVHELIVPAVKCKHTEIRGRGIVCLGLCSLIDQSMALDSFGLFLQQSSMPEQDLQVKIFQIVFDILLLYGVNFMESRGLAAEAIVSFMLHSLEQVPEVQAVASVGICKLMLSGMLNDLNVLQNLVLVYFAPETVDNHVLRQCLSYFFTVYCYSNPANQVKMKEIFLSSIEVLSGVFNETKKDKKGVKKENKEKDEMVSPLFIGYQMIDWMDPRKFETGAGLQPEEYVHADLAIDILQELFNKQSWKEDRKTLCQYLNKLYIPSEDQWRLKSLLVLLQNLKNVQPLSDKTSINALARFEKSISEKLPDAAEFKKLDEETLREVPELSHVFEFIDEAEVEDDLKPEKAPVPRRKTRRSSKEPSPGTSSSEEFDEDRQPSPSPREQPVRRSRRPAVKRKFVPSSEDDAEENKEEDGDTSDDENAQVEVEDGEEEDGNSDEPEDDDDE